jgi:hypothetical protein
MFTTANIKLNTVLGTKDDKIVLENYELDAGRLTSLANTAIKPKLNNINDLLKEYIEKEENIKIEKIWIEDGKLKVQ